MQPEKTTTEMLEELIDKHGLQHVLVGLELVCSEKAEHIRMNWQDQITAKPWDAAAKVCIAAARKVDV
jgi:hypothetical protein